MALTDKLSAIGNAIREKTGSTELLTLDAMPTAISGIECPKTTLTITNNKTTSLTFYHYVDGIVDNDFVNKESTKTYEAQVGHMYVVRCTGNTSSGDYTWNATSENMIINKLQTTGFNTNSSSAYRIYTYYFLMAVTGENPTVTFSA